VERAISAKLPIGGGACFKQNLPVVAVFLVRTPMLATLCIFVWAPTTPPLSLLFCPISAYSLLACLLLLSTLAHNHPSVYIPSTLYMCCLFCFVCAFIVVSVTFPHFCSCLIHYAHLFRHSLHLELRHRSHVHSGGVVSLSFTTEIPRKQDKVVKLTRDDVEAIDRTIQVHTVSCATTLSDLHFVKKLFFELHRA